MADGVQYVIAREGTGEPLPTGSKLKVAYVGKYLDGFTFVSTEDGGKPYFGQKPEPFEFEIGKALVNRGFDVAVAQMKKGEKRILIIPSGQAYGTGGYYDREKPGQRRFHISPNKTLVYEVEILNVMQ